MIKVNNLSYSFPQKDLFHEISFTLEDGQHCALIGSSGCGKSTLVDMLMYPEKYLFDGEIEIDSDSRMRYVSQFSQMDSTKEMTVFEYVSEEFVRLQGEITTICAEMETATDLDPLLEKYQQALDSFQAIGGDDFESNINKKLNLANLGKHENLMVSKLSGGEFKLVQVIKEMLTFPNILIMDEPDVFLDFENLNSLKNLINTHKGTLLVITHNRYLLNHCFNKIIHIENTQLQEFDGRYLDYNFSLLQGKIELQELALADDEEIERNEAVINRMRAIATNNSEASRGKTLNARVKLLERLEARKIKAPFLAMKQPAISFSSHKNLEDKIILEINDYSAAFDDLLLEHVNFSLKATDKVAIIGSNGTGKTTMLRDIYKNNQSSIKVSEEIDVAFLSQLQGEMLNESNTVFDEFYEAGFKTYQEVIDHIQNYGFAENDLTQTIGSMSGGEKNMIQLAKISAHNADLLLLDEPTSHLDTYSQIAMEKAITNYNGAILMISHYFYTIANCMDYVLLIDEKTIRKISIRKFRKMIYANHFDKDYLDTEEKKKAVETKIETALKSSDFELAKSLCEELESLIHLLS